MKVHQKQLGLGILKKVEEDLEQKKKILGFGKVGFLEEGEAGFHRMKLGFLEEKGVPIEG